MSLLQADARALPLADRSVQCCVTSPPYWGLRDYGTARWEGGDLACDHLGGPFRTKAKINANCGTGLDVKNAASRQPMGQTCRKCGAVRRDQQIGLEQTPDAYVAELVAVFREVRRVLKDDGVLWLNLGDSYAGGPSTGANGWKHGSIGSYSDRGRGAPVNKVAGGVKPKDLVGIPWRVAFALQADGWYLRSDIIWHKPNPMPESVTDRPTKSHEYVFLLAKAERYYYDTKAIREKDAGITGGRQRASVNGSDRYAAGFKISLDRGDGDRSLQITPCTGTRNARSVWTIATQPYSGAHFATMPEALAERCILASTKPGDRVLDPFGGSGTTARVALSLGRKAASVELNPAYLALAQERTHVTLGLPLEASA